MQWKGHIHRQIVLFPSWVSQSARCCLVFLPFQCHRFHAGCVLHQSPWIILTVSYWSLAFRCSLWNVREQCIDSFRCIFQKKILLQIPSPCSEKSQIISIFYKRKMKYFLINCTSVIKHLSKSQLQLYSLYCQGSFFSFYYSLMSHTFSFWCTLLYSVRPSCTQNS